MSAERRRRRALAPLAVALALLIAAPPSALGHGGNSDYRSVIDRVTPEVEGVEANVLNYDAELELLARTGTRVLVYGYEGEPYARVLADGTVQVNRRSPAAYLNEDRYGATAVPAAADAEAAPRWETVGGSGRFVFHDHRMHYMTTGLPPQVKDEGVRTKVFGYRIPIRVDGRPGAIEGTLFWVGPEDASKLPFAIAAVAIAALGGLAVILVRRRRARGDDDGSPGQPAKEAW